MNNKEERFQNLIRQQKEKILRVCRYYAGDHDDRKDLYQEILINTWNGMDSFRGDAQPGTWMYRIALNTALGFAGRKKRKMQISVSLDQKSLNTFKEDTFSAGDPGKEVLLSKMETLINQMSVIDKILVTLMLEELSYRDIAEIVGITEPNVRVKIHRIKNNLREKLKEASYENNE